MGNIRYQRTAHRITSAVNCRPLKPSPRSICPAATYPTGVHLPGIPPPAKFATEPAGLSPSKENRDAIRAPEADTAPHASAIERSERSQRRVPPCGYRPKPETTRPTKADEYASGHARRIAPRTAAQAPTKQPFQPVSETRRAFPIRGNT